MIGFIAWRYLRPQMSFISIIGMLSVIGIMLGTAALVIVMSIFNGFRGVASQMMAGFGPHARIVPRGGSVLPNPVGVQAAVPPGFVSYPVTESRVVLHVHGTTGVANAIGIEPADVGKLVGSERAMVVGTFTPVPFDNLPTAIVGLGLAEKHRLGLGDTITVLSPEQIERALTMMVKPTGRMMVVRGLFQSNSARDIDATWLFTDAASVRAITGKTGPTSIDVLVPKPLEIDEAIEPLRSNLAAEAVVQTWKDFHKGLYDTMQLERVGSFIVLALVVVVAAFNVLVSLTMGVVEKRRDIAVLRTMGATDDMIRKIWLIQGLALGLFATTVGTVTGVAVVLAQQHFALVGLGNSSAYLVSSLPVELHSADVIGTVVVSLALACSAAIYPARRASSMAIADAVRAD